MIVSSLPLGSIGIEKRQVPGTADDFAQSATVAAHAAADSFQAAVDAVKTTADTGHSIAKGTARLGG
ncbi:hypothetical protein G6F43_012096 [Rhizopus delemar]|nr:hypothetical protein G6F43_012096 [Rhizopus delemar]